MIDGIESIIERSRMVQDTGGQGIADCLKVLAGQTIGGALFAPLLIFDRINQTHAAIAILAERGLPTEGMILLSTEFELLLDLFYIGRKSGRATKWLGHTNTRDGPWTVKSKIEDVFQSDASRKKGALDLYEMMCAIKHGNPAAGILGLGYNYNRKEKKITFDDGEFNSLRSAVSTFVIATSTFQLCWATLHLVSVLSHYMDVEFVPSADIRANLDWAQGISRKVLDTEEFTTFGESESLGSILSQPTELIPYDGEG